MPSIKHFFAFTHSISYHSKISTKLAIVSILIFTVALATRTILINQIPTSLSHDELNYVINALSLTITGTGKSGKWYPFSFTPVEPTLAELPAIFIAPFMLFPFPNLVNARLPFIFMSLSLPFFIAFITWQLTKSRGSTYFSLTIALFNPWLWQNGRMAFDSIFSLWFYLFGMLIFLSTKKYWKLASLPLFFLGFYFCY